MKIMKLLIMQSSPALRCFRTSKFSPQRPVLKHRHCCYFSL